MNFEELLKDLGRLEKVNRELAELRKPENVAARAAEVFGGLVEKIRANMEGVKL